MGKLQLLKFILLTMLFSSFATAGSCPPDWRSLYQKYATKSEAQHKSIQSYQTTETIQAKMTDGSGKTTIRKYVLEKSYSSSSGVSYGPAHALVAQPDGSETVSEASINPGQFPDHVNEVASGVSDDETFVGRPSNWEAVKFSEKNYNFTCLALDTEEPKYKGKKVLKLSLDRPLSQSRGLFKSGELWIDAETFRPLEIHEGVPIHNPNWKVTKMKITQAFDATQDGEFPLETHVVIYARLSHLGDAIIKYSPAINLATSQSPIISTASSSDK